VNAVASAFLLTFAGLFPIVNPLEAAPFFLGLTAGLPAAERPVLARKASIPPAALGDWPSDTPVILTRAEIGPDSSLSTS